VDCRRGEGVRRKRLVLTGWLCLIVVWGVALVRGVNGAVATDAAKIAKSNKPEQSEARIEFWNRIITSQRGVLAGISPQERAARANERLSELPLNVSSGDIAVRPLEIENQDGIGFICRGQFLFFIGTDDLDKESSQTLEQVAQSAQRNLTEALQARVAERSWPVIRSGILFTVTGLLLLVSFCTVLWKANTRFIRFVRKREYSFPAGLRVFGFDFLPYIAAVIYSLVRTTTWLLTVIVVYLWVTLSLRRFPYTQPWGHEAGSYVVQLIEELATAALNALPGILAVILIFIVTRWVVRIAHALFEQIAEGHISVYWMDADVARATQRIFAAIAWIFAVIVAYPYIPGSQTDAFKGVSVFVGLVVSLGSTGIINQIMSGLFVVYSKALKTGEWVKVTDTEGEVLDVGLLAAKIRTIEGQEVTIPNSVLVGTSTVNFTRLGHPDGMVVSSTVTIGYDASWRQVHALLLRAADRTPNIRKHPAPYVLQRQLSDFYVEYTLIARLEDEKRRIESLSDLHSQIQDAFNEFGVQIMSPHYMVQPDASVVVPPAKWHVPPAEPKS
jgi:small-conductance mechanosensitive channel